MEKQFKYTAFISYNSRDNRTARWLQKRLESYNLPSVIVSDKGEILRSYDKQAKKFRIFRYVTDLVAQNLDDGLRQELEQSKFLIVICSPNSANATWVRREIKHFIDAGREKQIIPFVVKGTPYSDDIDECFTPELRAAFPNGSALGVSLKDCGDDPWIFNNRKAIAKIVSLLIDLPNAYDFIWNRYRVNYIKLLIARVVIVLMVVSAICFSVILVRQVEKPFYISVELNEENSNSKLPPIKQIEISMALDNAKPQIDTIFSLNERAVFGKIPGRMKGRPMKLKVRNIDCFGIDTILSVQQTVSVIMRRDPDRYGKVDVYIIKDDVLLCNELVSVDGITGKTNNEGKLQMDIPFPYQKETYTIRLGEYKGIIHMPCVGTKCIELK